MRSAVAGHDHSVSPAVRHKGEYLIGVDIGTSSVKAIAVRADGRLLAHSWVEIEMHRPRPGWAENVAEDWYEGCVLAIRRLLESGISADRSRGIAFVSQRDPMVLLDDNMHPLTPAISWTDRRTEGIAHELVERFGLAWLMQHTGVIPIAGLTLPIIVWTQRNLPDVWARTRHLLFAKDYVLYRLTGRVETDFTMPSRTIMNDLAADDWSAEICGGCDIPLEILPPILNRPWDCFDEFPEAAAELTGLPAGMPIAVGGGDDQSAALGSGAIDDDDLSAGTGTSSDWRCVKSTAMPDSAGHADVARHVVDGKWVLAVTIESTGSSLRWFRDAFPDPDVRQRGYLALMEQAESVPPGAEGLLFMPFVDGARRAPRYIDGATGSFHGIISGHTRAHFVRAILEGIAFQYPRTLELIAPSRPRTQPIAMVDAETRGEVWNQIKADVTGVPITTPAIYESAALGAVALAGQAGRVFSDARDAVEQLVHPARVYEPDTGRHALYAEIRERWEQIYGAVSSTYSTEAVPQRPPTATSTEV
jgi:sugar (pentulose or hexulose) kinase